MLSIVNYGKIEYREIYIANNGCTFAYCSGLL